MLREINDIPASCWIEGEPTKEGLYLTRWNRQGNFWFYLFECKFVDGRIMYLNHSGGNYKNDPALRIDCGQLTHHCNATVNNFLLLTNSLYDHKFNMEKYKYEC